MNCPPDQQMLNESNKKRNGVLSHNYIGKENIPPSNVSQMYRSMHISDDAIAPPAATETFSSVQTAADKENIIQAASSLSLGTADNVYEQSNAELVDLSSASTSKTSSVNYNNQGRLTKLSSRSSSSILAAEEKQPLQYTNNAGIHTNNHTDVGIELKEQQSHQHKQYLQNNPVKFAEDATEEEKRGITEFFKDNAERYPALLEDTMDPVPVLPILVPERMKIRFVLDKKTQKVMTVKDLPCDTTDPTRYVSMKDLTPASAFHPTAAAYKDNLSTATADQQSAFSSFLMRHGPSYFKKHPEQSEYTSSHNNSRLRNSNNDEIFDPHVAPLRFKANQQTIDADRKQTEQAQRKMDWVRKSMRSTSASFTDEQQKDPMMVAEYADEIYEHLYDTEVKMLPDANYLNVQSPEFSWGMRSILIDWVIEIHFLFGLMPETLFLAVNIIDRFLSVRQIALGKMQLVGLTALFIASKFEELASPLINDYLHMTDNNYNESQMKEAERFILDALDFRLLYPHPLNFIRRICSRDDFNDINVRTLAKYFAEISCLDEKLIAVRPSKIAAASVWLANKMLAYEKWKGTYRAHSGYATSELKEIVEIMLDYLARSDKHPAFFNKWKQENVSKASLFVKEWLRKYYKN
ncbi:cyclin-like protein [Mycotypha africana]|uniref:cyclin-like protein n=1 Tax=Mycotypha africana TaxID=64632 RepID=UPI0022FFD643|nr:cyclin-like protein [Mycotypha africana]KAI8979656.1 cyclin-like protein [Mycotypha africana]